MLFTFAGEALAKFVPVPLPAAIWGMLLLFAALCLGIVKTEQIKGCGAFLVAILPALFVAPTVGLMDQAGALLSKLPAILLIIVVSTFLTLLVSGKATQFAQKRFRKEGRK